MRYNMPILNQSQPPLPNSRPREHSFHPPVKHQVPVPWVQTSIAMNWPTRSSQCSNYYTPWKSRWCKCHISYHGPFTYHLQGTTFVGSPVPFTFTSGELGISMSETHPKNFCMSWPDPSVEPSSNSSTPPFQTSRKSWVLKKWLLQKIQQFFYRIHF